MHIIGFHVHDLNMVPRRTVYRQSGRYKNRILHFTKSGIKRLEEAYSRHYVWSWLDTFEGENVIRVYRRQYGIDWLYAVKEL